MYVNLIHLVNVQNDSMYRFKYSSVKKAVTLQVFDPKSIKGNLNYIIMPEFGLKHYWDTLTNVSILCNSVCSAHE